MSGQFKTRKLRFTLASIFVFVSVIACLLVPCANYARRLSATQAIRDAGGIVFSDEGEISPRQGVFDVAKSVTFNGISRVDNQVMESLVVLEQVTSIHLNCGGEDLPNLAPLAKHRDLQSIVIENAGSNSLVELARLHQLRKIRLVNVAIDKNGIEQIARAGQLRELEIHSCKINLEQFAAISRCQSLERLDLCRSILEEGALKSLHDLRNLSVLDLTGVELSQKSIIYISNATTLEQLFLGEVELTGLDLRPLAAISGLRKCVLDHNLDNGANELLELLPTCDFTIKNSYPPEKPDNNLDGEFGENPFSFQ